MKPANTLKTLLIIGLIGLQSACVYRLAIQQGNIAEAEEVDQVTIGMTPSQVRFLLGTPLVDDPFNNDRWDYVFHSRVGRKAPSTRQFLTVYFEDGKVARLEKRDPAPKESAVPEEEKEEQE